MTFGNTRFIKPEFSVGGYPSENLLLAADPNSGSQYISGTNVPATSGTRSDPNYWGLSDAADFTSIAWDNSGTSPNLMNRGIAMYVVANGNDSTGANFIESPLASLNNFMNNERLYAVVDEYATSGSWDVVLIRYNSSNVLQQIVPLAGGFSAFSSATVKSATFSGLIERFYGVGNISGFSVSDKFALRFRALTGATPGLIINTIYLSNTPIGMSGAYVPTWSNGSNVSLFQSPASRVQWSAVGDVVTMSGLGYLAFTSSPATIDMSLPLTTKFTSDIANADGSGNKDEQGGGTMFTRQNTCNGQTRCMINTGVIQWGIVGGTPTTNFFSWSAQYRLVNPGT